MLTLDNLATLDTYDKTLTLGPVPTAQLIKYVVANAAVIAQVAPQNPAGTEQEWGPEILVTPETNTVTLAQGIRFRSAVPGVPARIVAQLYQPDDPRFAGGTPFTPTLTPSGSLSNQVQIPTVALAAFPPANPTDQQAIYLALPASYDPIGGKAIRWLCVYDSALAMWHVTGAPLYGEVTTSETTTSAAYTDLATVGPSVVLPRPGDYMIAVGLDEWNNNPGSICQMDYAGGGIVAGNGGPVANIQTPTAAVVQSMNQSREREKAALTAGTLTAKYMTGGGTGRYEFRYLKVTPMRIT